MQFQNSLKIRDAKTTGNYRYDGSGNVKKKRKKKNGFVFCVETSSSWNAISEHLITFQKPLKLSKPSAGPSVTRCSYDVWIEISQHVKSCILWCKNGSLNTVTSAVKSLLAYGDTLPSVLLTCCLVNSLLKLYTLQPESSKSCPFVLQVRKAATSLSNFVIIGAFH